MPVSQSINQLQRDLTTISETTNASEKKNPFDYTKCSPGVFDTYTQAFIYNKYREDVDYQNEYDEILKFYPIHKLTYKFDEKTLKKESFLYHLLENFSQN